MLFTRLLIFGAFFLNDLLKTFFKQSVGETLLTVIDNFNGRNILKTSNSFLLYDCSKRILKN